ncbi:MAG: hypothetical protein JWM93_3908, partial [Frankiales bacterium]|nr:hypothetical protein [Frankiales bacterium]
SYVFNQAGLTLTGNAPDRIAQANDPTFDVTIVEARAVLVR